MKHTILLLSILFLVPPANASGSLCTPLPPLPEEADDLRMTEADFTEERFYSSLLYLQNDLPEKLKEAKETKELTGRAVFWVSYRNGLKFIEGYMLKQTAILERAAGHQQAKESAVEKFCSFVSGAKYVD